MAETVLTAPRARGLFILTAHPAGCRAQVDRLLGRARAAFPEPLLGARGKTALVIGNTSFGYGSSTAMALHAAGFDQIIGLGYETAPTFRGDKVAIASPGWYLTDELHRRGVTSRTYLADGFADATRDRVIRDLRGRGTQIDLLVYSVAAPRRTHLEEEWSSSLQVIGEPLTAMGLDFRTGEHKPVEVAPANPLQIEQTRRVMGGDDLDLWANALIYSGVANQGMIATALSYIGPDFEPLRRMYWDGALGAAKHHIDATTRSLRARLSRDFGGTALTVMNPAVVTSASVAIPAMTKYLADYLGAVECGTGIYDDPLDVGIHFAKSLYGEGEPWRGELDEEERLRLDQHELEPALQAAVQKEWLEAAEGSVSATTKTGFERFRREYLQLYGWEVPGVDYAAPCEWEVDMAANADIVDLLAG